MKIDAVLALSPDYGSGKATNEFIAQWAIYLANILEVLLVTDPYIPIDTRSINGPFRIVGGHRKEYPSIGDILRSALFLYNHFEAQEIKEVLVITSSKNSSQILQFAREIFKEPGVIFYCLSPHDGNYAEW